MNDRHMLYYLVLAPGAPRSEAAAKCLARWLGMSPYDARLKLADPLPRILRAVPSRADAVEMQMELDALGVRTRCLSHGQIVRRPPVFEATACDIGDDEVTFFCKPDEHLIVPNEDVRLLVHARIRERTEVRQTGRKRAGIVSSSRSDGLRTTDASFVLTLFAAGPRSFEIVQDEFDYGCLAGDKGMSSLHNFERLVGLLRERFEGALYDDTLCRAASDYDKVGESIKTFGLAGGRQKSRTFTDRRFVTEASWLIALMQMTEGR